MNDNTKTIKTNLLGDHLCRICQGGCTCCDPENCIACAECFHKGDVIQHWRISDRDGRTILDGLNRVVEPRKVVDTVKALAALNRPAPHPGADLVEAARAFLEGKQKEHYGTRRQLSDDPIYEWIAAFTETVIAERIRHCTNCGSDWVDNGINSGCSCEAIAEMGERLAEALKRYSSSLPDAFRQDCEFVEDLPELCRTHNYDQPCPVAQLKAALGNPPDAAEKADSTNLSE